MQTLTLYSTLGCHLCEQALELVTPIVAAIAADKYQIEIVDISESEVLLERYGIRIPVIARADDELEISWPFDGPQFLDFLNVPG